MLLTIPASGMAEMGAVAGMVVQGAPLGLVHDGPRQARPRISSRTTAKGCRMKKGPGDETEAISFGDTIAVST
jgi:hypothetical protein